MSRPKRIQYEGACYHVSNSGDGERPIASCDEHRKMFVELLSEIHEQFDAEIHAWCLTDDCYHILVTTPLANLSRVMRHLNGVYTQKLNRQEKTKGSVFKGRYKSILIDPVLYLLHVGKKIHKTPQETKFVNDITEYLWSSYRNYMGLSDSPTWLETKKTHAMLKDHQGKYDLFMASLDDEFVSNFYTKKRMGNILGDEEFQQNIHKLYPVKEVKPLKKNITEITTKRICRVVADELKIDLKDVYASRRGDTNIARLIAVYLHHVFAHYGQKEIADIFKFKQAGSVGSSFYRYKKLRQSFPEIKAIESNILEKLNS